MEKNGSNERNENNESIIKLILLVAVLTLILLVVIILNIVDGKKNKKEAATEDLKSIAEAGITEEIETEKPAEKHIYTINEVESAIKPVGDLITSEYHYKDAGVYEDYKTFFGARVPLTTDKQVFTYKGTVKLGYDFEKIEYEIDNENKKISVILPELEILSNEIHHDSFEVVDSKDSILNSQDFSDFNALEAELLEKKKNEVINDTEVRETAEKNAKALIVDFLKENPDFKDFNVDVSVKNVDN